MTTGPRPTPHPIILHIDDNGNPVRLAEASAIYVTSAVIGTLSATNYVGLNVDGGIPVGVGTEVQFRKNSTEFDGDTSLTFDKVNQRLNATEIVVGDLSATNKLYSEETITAAQGIFARSVSSTSATALTLSATTISAVTVCATNYNSLFDSLSFQNLDNRYLNSSGDSVTGSFYLQNLSSVTISATSYQNLPSALATWNASAIRGIPVTSTAPLLGQALIYSDGAWQPSSLAVGPGAGTPGGVALSLQFNNGVFSGVDSIKYDPSINGIQSVALSSTNLSSVNISVGVISATTYENLKEGTAQWNANKIQDVPVSKPGSIVNHKDILAGSNGTNRFEVFGIDTYSFWVYEQVKSNIHAELPKTDASAIQGIAVTATAPTTNNVLIYNGSVWTPSGSISLGTIAATNLGGTNIVGTNASINNVSSTGLSALALSATNLSAINARITALSATTLSATTYLNLPSGTATWNASAIKGATVLAVDGGITTANPIGTLIYNKNTNEYFTLPFSSTVLNGSRNLAELPYQGQVVASYLGSASEYFQINPAWNTPGFSIYDIPINKDVLVFSSDLYGLGGGAWTWEQPSSLFTTNAAGSTGYVQFAGADNTFDANSQFTYTTATKTLTVSNITTLASGAITIPSGTIFLAAAQDPTYISNQGINTRFLQVLGSTKSPSVSATTYVLFNKQTSSTPDIPTPTANNQTITYDLTGERWKPGYTIYQATGTPSNSLGNNGDIYFQYLP